MIGRFGQLIGNIKLTTMIAALVICAIIVSVGVVSVVIFVNLSASATETAMRQQITNLKAAATIVEGSLPGAEVEWSDTGEIASVRTWAMPRQFLDNGLVDSIARVTGEAATIFGWNEEEQDFVRMTTTIEGADGTRILGTPLGKSGAVYASIMEGKAYFGEANIVGRPYYTAYQPILDQAGTPVGILFVGIDRTDIDAVIYGTLQLLLAVGAITLVVLGGIGYWLSRVMMGPVPRLATTMKQVADGDYTVEVAYKERGNEIGNMARAVEVFRLNGQKMADMTEEERAAVQRRSVERTDMMVTLQAAFGEVVDAAIAGDFSKRVHAQFPDPELNALATTSIVDIYRRSLVPDRSDQHYFTASKLMTIGWGLVALGFAAVANLFDNLIQAVNIIGSLFYGVILGVFVVAFFFKQVGGKAVFNAAIIGQLFVGATFVLSWLGYIDLAYLWLNLIGCVITVAIAVVLEQVTSSSDDPSLLA